MSDEHAKAMKLHAELVGVHGDDCAAMCSETIARALREADQRGYERGVREEREQCARRVEASIAAKGPNIVPAARVAFEEAANTCRAGWTTSSVMAPEREGR